jgi:ribosome-associated protein
MPSNNNTIEVNYQPIELCKLLKIANVVSGGGEAKIVISEGYVLVNQAVETQKRKKIYHNDIIEFNGEQIHVTCSTPIGEKAKSTATKNKQDIKKVTDKKRSHQNKKNKSDKKTKGSIPASAPLKKEQGQRKRISF